MHMTDQVEKKKAAPKWREQGKWRQAIGNLPYRKKLNNHYLSKLCILYKLKYSVFKSLGGANKKYIKCLKILS